MAEDSGFASDPLAIRAAALERRRKMMAAILGKQMEGEDKAVEMVGGVAVPAWGAAVSKLANAASRAFQERGFQQEEAQLLREGQLRDEAALAQYKLKLEGQPAVPGVQKPLEYDQGGGVFTRPVPAPGEPIPMVTEGGRPAVPRDFQGALDYAAGSPSAKVRALAKAAQDRWERVMQTPDIPADIKAQYTRTGDPALLRGPQYVPEKTAGGVEVDRNMDTGQRKSVGQSGNTTPESQADAVRAKMWAEKNIGQIIDLSAAVGKVKGSIPGLMDIYSNIDRAFTGDKLISGLQLFGATTLKKLGLNPDKEGRIPATQMIMVHLAPKIAQILKDMRPASNIDKEFAAQASAADPSTAPETFKGAMRFILSEFYNDANKLGSLTEIESRLKGAEDVQERYGHSVQFPSQGLEAYGVEYDPEANVFRAQSVIGPTPGMGMAPAAPAAPAAAAPAAAPAAPPAAPVAPPAAPQAQMPPAPPVTAPAPPQAPPQGAPVSPQLPAPAAATPPAMQVSPEVQRQRDLVGLEMRRIELQEAQGVLAQAQAKGDPAAVAQAQSVVQNHLREIAAMEKQLGVRPGTTAPPMPANLSNMSNDEFARLLEERRRGRQ